MNRIESRRSVAWSVAALIGLALVLAGAAVGADDRADDRAAQNRKLNKLSRGIVRADNSVLYQYIKGMAKKVAGQPGTWSFKIRDVEVAVVTDERADRMRIVSAITQANDLPRERLVTLLEANFDRALDAKYSIWKGAVWAVYTHPLSPITKDEFTSAVNQVVALVENYGTTFQSLDVVFGP